MSYLLRLNNQQKVMLNVFVVYEEAHERRLPGPAAEVDDIIKYQWTAVTRGRGLFSIHQH